MASIFTTHVLFVNYYHHKKTSQATRDDPDTESRDSNPGLNVFDPTPSSAKLYIIQ